MKLNKFKTDSFAGINNKDVEFSEGLNVLLGPNEAGKSTLIEAIFATIFKNVKLRMNYSDDREFNERFMPYPDGDYIHGCLHFEIDGQKYRVEKEWGENYSVFLELPDGQKINSFDKVNEYINDLFIYGEGTYSNIVFVKQQDVKNAINRIVSNKNVTGAISSFLRKTVMELDGINIDRLKEKIGEELDELLKKWDIDNDRPTNLDRDVNNPYKVGYGQVYGAYINTEQIRLDMEKTQRLEKEFEDISQSLKEIKEERTEIENKIKELASLEKDIFKRGQVEPKIDTLKEKIEDMKEINTKWPVLENELKKNSNKQEEHNEKLEKLAEEKKEAEEQAQIKEITGLLGKIEDKKKEIDDLKEKKEEIKEITADDVKKLENIQSKIATTRASIEAATLVGRINSAPGKVTVTRGIEEKEEIEAGREFKADGYIHIQSGELDIEIESGNIDFQSLQKQYSELKKEYDEFLADKGIKDMDEARKNLEKLNNSNNQVKMIKQQIDDLLDGKDYNELTEKAANLPEEKEVRDVKEIDEEIEEVRDKIQEIQIEINTAETRIQDWKDKYESHDKLFDFLLETRGDIKEMEKELADLAELPEGFKSAEEFNSHLAGLRDKKDELDHKFNESKEEMYEIKQQLPDISYEEFSLIYEDNKNEFERLKSRANSLLKIKEVFEDKLEEMDQDSFKPLVNSFSKYLSILTKGNYEVGEIDDSFEIKVKNKENKTLPANINLLSYGTYDGVALALRFALLEQLFKDTQGFIIMDDCLVNLDLDRKKEAVELINTFTENNQIIFTTCDPDTAEMLGGNVVRV